MGASGSTEHGISEEEKEWKTDKGGYGPTEHCLQKKKTTMGMGCWICVTAHSTKQCETSQTDQNIKCNT